MTINVTFDNFEDMEDFAKKLLGGKVSAIPQEVTTTVQESAAPVRVTSNYDTEGGCRDYSQNPVIPNTQPVQQQPVQQVPVTTPQQLQPSVVPTTVASYTLDDLARAAMTLMDAGRQADLQQLLAKYQVDALPSLPTNLYGAFATDLRGMGAQI